MNNERMRSVLEKWFEARDGAPPDVRRSARQVMERRPQVRQRSRWWPFPVFYRRTETPTTTDTVDLQPGPIPASNGQTPTVIGRTTSMLSPAKAIVAGALVFAVGGVLLIAQPFQQQGGTPAAAIDTCSTPVAPARGFIRWGHEEPGTETIVSATGEHIREFHYVNTMQMEDDRLDGSTSGVNEWDFSLNDGGSARNSYGPFDPARAGVSRGTFRIENGDGSWEGPWVGAGESLYSWHAVVTLTGAEGYEGLSATLLLTSSRESVAPVVGSIYPTDIASCEFTAAE